MKNQRTGLAVAMAAAAWMSVPAHAAIYGVPGEALLVPFVAEDQGEGRVDDDPIYSAVILHTPCLAGTDTVLSGYTLPNVLDGNATYTFPGECQSGGSDEKVQVGWYLYNADSVKIADGTFEMSGGDTYMWSPNFESLENVGYVLFTNANTRDGDEAATFALAGNAFLLIDSGALELGGEPNPDGESSGLGDDNLDVAYSLPVVAVPDGVDYCIPRPVAGGFDGRFPLATYPAAKIGTCSARVDQMTGVPQGGPDGPPNLAITYLNGVVANFPPSPTPGNNPLSNYPGHVSPLVAGVRMQAPFSSTNADGAAGPLDGGQFTSVYVSGLFSPFDGNWTQVFWFSDNAGYSNGPSRQVSWGVFDDDENYASCGPIFMNRELNAFVFADNENRIYDLVTGFDYQTDGLGASVFEDACLLENGLVKGDPDRPLSECSKICSGAIGSTVFAWNDTGYTQSRPGVGVAEYRIDAGPYDTSTGLFFQFMSDIDWSGRADNDAGLDQLGIGNRFDVRDAGAQPMTELGKI
jgi:hypothetical protein